MSMSEIQSEETKIAVLQETVGNLKDTVNRIEDTVTKISDKLDDKYVSRDEFKFWRGIIVSSLGITFMTCIGILIYILEKHL